VFIQSSTEFPSRFANVDLIAVLTWDFVDDSLCSSVAGFVFTRRDLMVVTVLKVVQYIHLFSVELERKDSLRGLLQSSSCECLDLPIATFFSGLEVVVIDAL